MVRQVRYSLAVSPSTLNPYASPYSAVRCFLFWGLLLPSVVQAQFDVIWEREGTTQLARYGTVLPLGDQNDDGFNDWAVFAVGPYENSDTDSCYLEFFYGGSPPSVTPYRAWRLPNANAGYVDASVVGDVNGDGHVDWIFGRSYSASEWRYYAHIYYGGPDADHIIDLLIPLSSFPEQARPSGDFNGDGFDDVWVYDFEFMILRIYYGGSPMDTLPDWIRHDSDPLITSTYPTGHGDLNGDGYADFVSAFGEDTVFFYLGGAALDTVPSVRWTDVQSGQVNIVADLNGDDMDDIIEHWWGEATVTYGSSELVHIPQYHLVGPCPNGTGSYATGIGDVNYDGFSDVYMVNSYCNIWAGGIATVHLGGVMLDSLPIAEFRARTEPMNFQAVSWAYPLGDVNGDGTDDFAVSGRSMADDERGRVVILAGNDTLRSAMPDVGHFIPTQFNFMVFPNPFNSSTTIELDLPAHVKDVTLALFDVLGRIAFETRIGNSTGHVKYVLDASGLATGLYFVNVRAGVSQAVKKVMLIR